MTPTKDQQAQKYAEKKVQTLDKAVLRPFTDIKQAYLDGYTACEQSVWRSVEEELPNTDDDVIVWTGSSLHVASFWESKWYSADDSFRTFPLMWMPIPPIPDTNTEKK